MDLNNFSINLKISRLNLLLAKMQIDIQYSFLVKTGDDKKAFISYAKSVVKNATIIFNNGQINDLDLETKNKTIAEWNNKIDELLCCFPEYMKDDIKKI